MLEIHNSFNVFVPLLNFNDVCQELTVEAFASTKNAKIILKVHVPKRNVTPLL